MSGHASYDVVIIGGGPGGATAAYDLAGAGVSVLMIERERFPRYHIGESLTGLVGDFIREMGLAEAMDERLFPLKSGVKVIGREAKGEFFVPVLRPTWQVRRDEFDQIMLDRAVASGAQLRLGTVVAVQRTQDRVSGVHYVPAGADRQSAIAVRAQVVIDASGQHTLLSRLGVAGPRQVDAFGRQIAIFSQYRNVVRDPGQMGNNTFIFYSKVHHWSWFIPLSPEVVSIGVVLPVDLYKEHGDSPERIMSWGLENINPDLTARVQSAVRVDDVHVIRNYSYRIDPFVGNGWLCIGDSHRFADPIFSFGVASAMLEARKASSVIVSALQSGSCAQPFAEFEAFSNLGQDGIYDLVRYFWKYPAFFGIQSRGKLRKDIIRMFAGDVFSQEVQQPLAGMRHSLYGAPAERLPDAWSHEVARRVLCRFADFQGIAVAYMQLRGEGAELSFVIDENAPEVVQLVDSFSEDLCKEFGADKLSISRRFDHHATLPPLLPRDAHLLISNHTPR